LTIYLPEMSAADLEAIFMNYVKNMNLDIGKRVIEVNLNKTSTFCKDFANISFCMRFKAGKGDNKYVGFFQIAMNPIGQKLRKD